jgi:hypothetical protein
MKQYVLELAPGAQAPEAPAGEAPPTEDVPAGQTRPARSWRLLATLAVVEPIVLAVLYVALVGRPSWADAKDDGRGAPAMAATATPAQTAATASLPPAPPPQAAPVAAALPGAPEAPLARPSRVTHEQGRFVIELHGTAIEPALAMLSAATRTTVTGAEVFAGSPQRIERSLVASSPREAWQAVFGELGNFAITCAPQGCKVHFVAVSNAPITPHASMAGMAGTAGTATLQDAAPPEPETVSVAAPNRGLAPHAQPGDAPSSEEN